MSDKKIATQVLKLVKKKKMKEKHITNNIKLKYSSVKKGVYAISPQSYRSLKMLRKDDLEDFYNMKGNAVTGSGGDPWIVANKKTLKYLSGSKKVKASKSKKVKSKSKSKKKVKAKSKSKKKVKSKSKSKKKVKAKSKKVKKASKSKKVKKASKSKSANKVKKASKSRGCVRQFSKKYTSRKSPPYPANECCGMVKRGNNGLDWLSKRASNGVCRWKPLNFLVYRP
jgi:hypothetical protein